MFIVEGENVPSQAGFGAKTGASEGALGGPGACSSAAAAGWGKPLNPTPLASAAAEEISRRRRVRLMTAASEWILRGPGVPVRRAMIPKVGRSTEGPVSRRTHGDCDATVLRTAVTARAATNHTWRDPSAGNLFASTGVVSPRGYSTISVACTRTD